MKKTYCLTAILLIFGICFTNLYAQKQKQIFPSKSKDNQSELIDTRVDNMTYWKSLAKKGLVPVAPVKPIPPAKYTGSMIYAKSIKGGKEDSPDVPVTQQTNVTQTENSIFVNPANNELILNSNNSTSWNGGSAGTLYGANYFISEDAGLTWGGTSQGAGGENSGDPATAINLDGSRMYVGFINEDYGQSVSYSTDGGASWTPVLCANAAGGWTTLLDKNHLWIDNSPSSPYEGNLYNAWTSFGGTNDNEIETVKSTDGGLLWSAPINISLATFAGSHNQGVNLKTGPNGEVYAVWSIYDSWPSDETAMGFAKSTNGGAYYQPASRIITNIRGVRNTSIGKNQRKNSFPSMACDISTGPYSGNLYIVWANVGIPGINTGTDRDIYMIKSEDGGDNWSEPIRVNQDPIGLGNVHYFPWITCDPETGTLSVVFYDDRNVGGTECEVFCANSADGGDTWEDFKVSDISFTPSPMPGMAADYMGDYLGIVARGGIVYPAWTDNRNSLFMTYTSPYYPNNLPKPTDLLLTLDEESGETTLSWQFENSKEFLYFNVYRDDELINTTTELIYEDELPDYGLYEYSISAMHDEGESTDASASIQWGNANISVSPEALNANLETGTSTVETVTIENIGELDLEYTVSSNINSKKKGKDYCEASGGCGEFIYQVICGDINNTSSCSGYTDYSDMSTLVLPGASFNITVQNGDPYNDDDLGIWIDWNQDGDFDDENENVVCEANNFGQGTYAIDVPIDAAPGACRMRVRIKYYDADCGDPCGTTTYGEVEDYTVFVAGWLIFDNYGGTIPAGGSEVINVTLDAYDLNSGTYTAELNIGSNDPDNAMVIVPVTLAVGNAMSVAAYADPALVCLGDSTQLFAEVTGGSGTYTYTWSSNPEGFSSTEQNPVITPDDTTSYIIEVFDGTITVIDSTTVDVTIIPGPCATPTGETVFCQDPQNTTYTTVGAEHATSYIWTLSPEEAGSISGGGNIGIVNWNADFSGEALLSVYGVNVCGDGQTSESLTVTINALPDVELDLGVDTVGLNTPVFPLSGGSPLGGAYSGNGVYENNGIYYFNPEAAGLGNHVITYTYADQNACENYAADEVYVVEIVGINEIIDGVQLEIYPNPSNGIFTIKLSSGANEAMNLRIVNNLGKIVYAEYDVQLGESFIRNVDLSDNAEGLYFINLSSTEANYMKKIIIRQ